MRQHASVSLIVKIGVVILLVEALVLTSLGIFYTNRFSAEIDRSLDERIRIPGVLMNRQLLRYESVADKQIMTELVGDEFIAGMVVSPDGDIYYALDAALVGTNIQDIPDLPLGLFSRETGSMVMRQELPDDRTSLVSVTPIMAFDGGDPVFYVYVQSMTVAAQQRKTAVTWLFVFGSAVVVLLTSLALIILTRSMVTRPLSALAVSAERLAQGKLDEPIDTSRNDELGGLARNFLNMRDAVSQTIGELELSNQELNQERMRLQAMVKALPDLILVVDDSGVCLEAMASGDEALLATPVSMMKGTPMTSIFPREAGEACLSLVRSTIETGKTMSLVFRVVGPRGPRWLEGRSSRISLRGDEPGTAIWISRDITESKRLEDSLRVAKEEAELANAQLRRLDDLKSAFLASVSHELRTPLTSFLGFAKLIAKNFHRHFRGQVEENSLLAKKADQIEDNLAIMAQEGDRLTRLINDVLDLNRISSGHMSWHDQIVAPHHAAAMAADSVSGMFEDKADVELMVHVPTDLPQLKIDPDRLLQVIINLLNNAAKFTHSGAVTLKAKLVDQGWLAFTVEDTGEGIPEHEALAIFDKFHQVERSDTLAANRKGAGLGLPICKEIVEHYGGKIWVESVAGQGSAFTFTLPVTPS